MKWQSLHLVPIPGVVPDLVSHWLYPAANGNDLYPRWYLEDRLGQLGAKPSEPVRANVSVRAAVN